MSEKWLTAQWQQFCLDAMRESLDVHADLKREMIQFLFDEGFWDQDKLGWNSAVTKFNACLRPDTPETFSNIQLWALIKRFNRTAWFLAMADDLGFEVRKKATEERRIELINQLVAGVEQSNKLTSLAIACLQQFGGPTTTAPRVHPAISEHKANFDLSDEQFPFALTGVANV